MSELSDDGNQESFNNYGKLFLKQLWPGWIVIVIGSQFVENFENWAGD